MVILSKMLFLIVCLVEILDITLLFLFFEVTEKDDRSVLFAALQEFIGPSPTQAWACYMAWTKSIAGM